MHFSHWQHGRSADRTQSSMRSRYSSGAAQAGCRVGLQKAYSTRPTGTARSSKRARHLTRMARGCHEHTGSAQSEMPIGSTKPSVQRQCISLREAFHCSLGVDRQFWGGFHGSSSGHFEGYNSAPTQRHSPERRLRRIYPNPVATPIAKTRQSGPPDWLLRGLCSRSSTKPRSSYWIGAFCLFPLREL